MPLSPLQSGAEITDSNGVQIRGFDAGLVLTRSRAELCDWLLGNTGVEPAAIAVATKVPQEPVAEALLGLDYCMFSCNPKRLDRFTVAGAKEDRLGARVLADVLRTNGRLFRLLAPSHSVAVELCERSRMAEDLRGERNSLRK